ncbi:MAG: zinc-binding dehydrogenase [Chthoniobacterales bacterium]|nr:zinc-binding dehydrogenase [Chthoniobacterales bacterium]
MKAAVVVTPGTVEVREIFLPEPGPFEALVRIEACGLCGTTDRHIVAGHMAHHPADWYPAILGHEAVGRVIQVGEKVRKFRVGDRVTRPSALWPGTHRDGLYSAWGGFAEFGIVRDSTPSGAPESDYQSSRQHVVPEGLSLEDAVAAISFSEVASWMEKLGDIRGASLLIGGTGFAACVMCQCAQSKGAGQIIVVGRNPGKLEWARKNGATHVIPLEKLTKPLLQDITSSQGVDWFLDAAGHQAVFETGLAHLKAGGKAAIYGAPDGFSYTLPLGKVGGDFEVKMLFPADDAFFDQTARLMSEGHLKASLVRTHVWHGLNALPRALEEQAAGHVLKGVLLLDETAGAYSSMIAR